MADSTQRIAELTAKITQAASKKPDGWVMEIKRCANTLRRVPGEMPRELSQSVKGYLSAGVNNRPDLLPGLLSVISNLGASAARSKKPAADVATS